MIVGGIMISVIMILLWWFTYMHMRRLGLTKYLSPDENVLNTRIRRFSYEAWFPGDIRYHGVARGPGNKATFMSVTLEYLNEPRCEMDDPGLGIDVPLRRTLAVDPSFDVDEDQWG
jgi:hypothetical protein